MESFHLSNILSQVWRVKISWCCWRWCGSVGQISGGPCHVMLGLWDTRAKAGPRQKAGQETREIWQTVRLGQTRTKSSPPILPEYYRFHKISIVLARLSLHGPSWLKSQFFLSAFLLMFGNEFQFPKSKNFSFLWMFGSWANRKAGCAKRSSFWSEQSIFRQTQRYNNTETQHL